MESTVPRNEKAWAFFNDVLGAPKMSVAPMVDGSELPFRMLCRKYGAQMAWSPMYHRYASQAQLEFIKKY